MLVVDGVSKGFFRGDSFVAVLRDVSLRVGAGEVVAVTSRRRLAGKTTLLEVVAGLQAADAGSVTLDGRRVLAAEGRRWRRRARTGPVLGHDIVWVGASGPNRELEVSWYVGSPLAARGRGRDVRRLAAQALERVGAQSCAGRRWGELSNWQRALVGLARAFAGSPQLVVIDDLLDGHGSRDTEHASDLLNMLVEESERPCAVVLSTGYYESALVLADQVWSITSNGALTPRSRSTHSEPQNATILPFTSGEMHRKRSAGTG